MLKKEKSKGDFWLWACIDADTKLVLSHKVGKRDYWTGYDFVKSVRSRVSGPVQIATDNWRQYPFTATEWRQRYSASQCYRMERWRGSDATKVSER